MKLVKNNIVKEVEGRLAGDYMSAGWEEFKEEGLKKKENRTFAKKKNNKEEE